MKYRLLICLFLLAFNGVAQRQSATENQKPKLVIGIVADQMRWDYLCRYKARYGKGGFNRLLKSGFSFNNVMINYSPSVTSVGHSTIYTGSVPAINGITGNTWIDVATGKRVYCVSDSTVSGIGAGVTSGLVADEGEVAGQMSPRNLLASTITDELKLATNNRAKVIGISLKDRAAILPAGHAADIAYWLDDKSGRFISSTYYVSALPAWVNTFNDQLLPDKLVANNWNTLYPIETYTQSSKDDVSWEGHFLGEKTASFPHVLASAFKADKGTIRTTPFGNELTLEFAKTAIKEHQMGAGAETDFLTINLASTDYVGHMFGPNSIEIEDVYLRLDQQLELFFNYLDQTIGKDKYLLFLTADHGAAHAPAFLDGKKVPSGVLDMAKLQKSVNAELAKTFGEKDLVIAILNYRVYFNPQKIKNNKNYSDIKKAVANYLESLNGIQMVVDCENMGDRAVPEPIKSMVANGFNKKRSGPLVVIPEPAWIAGRKTGTTHGAWNPYDTHIPLVFMGWSISPGSSTEVHAMTDIAATLAALLHIQMPNGSVGKPLQEILNKK